MRQKFKTYITTLKLFKGGFAVIRKSFSNGYVILSRGYGSREDAARQGRLIAQQEGLEFKEKK
jgi:hypothetical protein